MDAPPGTDTQSRTPEYLETHIRKALEAVNDRTPRTPLTAASFPEETLQQIAPTVTPSDEYFKTSIETAHKAILYDIAVGTPFASTNYTFLTPTHTDGGATPWQ